MSQNEIPSLLGKEYNILTSQGGISGKFDLVQPNYLFLGTSLIYEPNQVKLSIKRNNTSFNSITKTQNERSVAVAIEKMASGSPIYGSILRLNSIIDAQNAFDQLSGQIHADIATSQLNNSYHLRDTLNDRLYQLERSIPLSGIQSNAQGAWVKLLRSWSHTESDGNATSYNTSNAGILLGADTTFMHNWRLGVATGYTHTSINNNHHSNAGSDNYHLLVYGGKQFNHYSYRMGGGSLDITLIPHVKLIIVLIIIIIHPVTPHIPRKYFLRSTITYIWGQ